MARKQFSSEFKAKVALEALKGKKTIAQLSSEYGGAEPFDRMGAVVELIKAFAVKLRTRLSRINR